MGDEMSCFLPARKLWQLPAIFAVFKINFVHFSNAYAMLRI
jgi:hypothetical protein